MFTFVLIIHIIVSLLLMAVILLQDGKGGDIVSTMGGGGGSNTVFGSTGATSFLTKGTITLTVIFVLTSLSLAILKTKEKKSLLDTVKPAVETSAPATAVTPVEKKDEGTTKEASENQGVKEEKKEATDAKAIENKENTKEESNAEKPEKK